MNSQILYFVKIVCTFLPETRCFRLKRSLYRFGGIKIGKNVRICSSVEIIGNGSLSIGDNTWIGPKCLISVSSDVKIGKYCDIAPRVSIITGSHFVDVEGPSIAGPGMSKGIVIGDGCWICASSTILGTTNIGSKSIVAAGAITKGDYGDYELIAGIIAKTKKKLNNDKE